MRKRLLKSLLLLCALIVGSGTMLAADQTLFDVTTASNWSTSYNTYSSTIWSSNGCIFVQASNNQKGWAYVRLGGKNISNVDAYIATTTATTIQTKQLDVTVVQAKSNSGLTINSITLYVYGSYNSSTKTYSDEVEHISYSVSDYAAGTMTFEPSDADYWDSGVYFKLVYNVSNSSTSKNYGTDVSKLVAKEYTGGSSAAATTTTINPSGITNTDVYTSTSAGSLSASVTSGGNAVPGATVTWSGDNDAVATINASTGAVTLVGPGNVKFTASYSGQSGEYQASYAEYNMTVISSAPVTEETFTFSALGYTNAQSVATVNGSACTLTFDIGTNTTNNDPRYYDTGTGARMYTGNTLTIASATKTIESIEFTFDGNNTTLALVSEQQGTLSDASNSKRTWTGSASSIQFTTTATNRIQAIKVVYDSKTASDLTLTSSSAVALEKTTANVSPTSTITWNTSSMGAITCTSNNTGVATVTNAGVITAQGEGSATITVSQAADDSYKAGEFTVNVTVTDNRSAVVTGLDLPTAQKTLTVGDTDNFAATATVDANFTGTVTYSYATSDATVVDVADETYSAEGVGTATITITATPTGGNAANYKPATQDVVVTVKGATTLSLSSNSVTTTYGTPATVTATVADGYDGTLTISSGNTSVVTASVEGTTVTITPVAVGTTTVTVTAPSTSNFKGSVERTFALTVTAPEGVSTAMPITTAADDQVLFHETFGDNDESARAWDDSYSVKSGVSEVYSGITNYTVSNVKQSKNTTGSDASGLSQSSQGTDAYIIIGPLSVANYSDLKLTYQWKAASIKGTYTTSAYYATSSTGDYTEITGAGDGATSFVERSYSLPAAAQVSTLYLKIVWNTSNTQGIIDEVELTGDTEASEPITATLNPAGYGTYCSEYPLDFSEATDYSAWYIIGTSGEAITFVKVSGPVKGGTGLFLKGENGTTGEIELTSVNSTNTLSDNMLVGTLAPTYFEEDAIYGLSGNTFKLNYAGTFKANKAYIPAYLIDGNGESARAFTFVFVDPTTGITETRNVSAEEFGEIFNLAGQRMNKPQKGVNIINGKKVLVK